jgi:hypothetical protein
LQGQLKTAQFGLEHNRAVYDAGNADDFAAHADDDTPKANASWPKVAANLELDQYH